MQTTYRVPFEDAESEFTEKRSRFISHLWRVETEAEARQHIAQAVEVAKKTEITLNEMTELLKTLYEED